MILTVSSCEIPRFAAIDESKRKDSVELANAYKFHRKTRNTWFNASSIRALFNGKHCGQYPGVEELLINNSAIKILKSFLHPSTE